MSGADPETHCAVLIAGPGTAAVEAALGSLVPRDGRVLIIENGAYGERAAEIATTLQIPVDVWSLPWTVCPSPVEFAARITAGRFTHAFWVHHETTTGMLTPLAEYGRICRSCGVVSIVDAMSSFAGLPISLREDAVDFIISSANKCLQGMPGVSFVLGPQELIERSSAIGRTYTLNLARHEASLINGQFPFTPPVQVLYAMACALQETLTETVAARAARYRACYSVMLDGMEQLGFRTVLPKALHSQLLTAFHSHDAPGFSFEQLHDYLYARDITLYPGKLRHEKSFRVANIGALTPHDMRGFIAAVREYLHEN
ncbi:2-aminoethylphosphonate--pyruvate transaminase [Lacunisphaera limnophila]|uniref:2-aminoethylphosphonate--pyruvate transaminase n=1 Tax=Lacunisphaera limnophila TaxID=1838286 RepID=A0A1D8AZ13_9BACT|nr:2-aminoethylphosphonate--pyruvate transaminase [Lacunisphaera limnophila]